MTISYGASCGTERPLKFRKTISENSAIMITKRYVQEGAERTGAKYVFVNSRNLEADISQFKFTGITVGP